MVRNLTGFVMKCINAIKNEIAAMLNRRIILLAMIINANSFLVIENLCYY